jgi:two-component system response regulator FixJ
MTASILIVDDDADVRDSLRALLESAGFTVRDFGSAKRVLEDTTVADGACLIADIRMPDMDGLTLQEELARRQVGLPVIIVTGHGDIPLAVRAMRAGAIDFIEKPFDDELLLESIQRALDHGKENRSQTLLAQTAAARIALLTEREQQVLECLVRGLSNKIIAYELDISPRTVEIHRAHVMEKMQARSLSEVVRLAFAAGLGLSPRT